MRSPYEGSDITTVSLAVSLKKNFLFSKESMYSPLLGYWV
jgi:hypothetical protein